MKSKFEKPLKKIDKLIYALIEENIESKDYYFEAHARQRKKERGISDLAVLNILKDLPKYKRKRNKSKDRYDSKFQDWNYCIEGFDVVTEKNIRIIISFTEESNLLIITVINLDTRE